MHKPFDIHEMPGEEIAEFYDNCYLSGLEKHFKHSEYWQNIYRIKKSDWMNTTDMFKQSIRGYLKEAIMPDGCFDGRVEDIKAFIRTLLHSVKVWNAQLND